MSNNFVIVTDDSCDLPLEYLRERNITFLELSYMIDSKEYFGSDRPTKALYDDMRAGKMPVTAQVNQQRFTEHFTIFLDEGKDLLYLAFSSGLSGTCHSGQAAAKDLSEKYPDRKIYVVDTLCASIGQGLLVDKVYNKMLEGSNIDELREYAEYLSHRIIHTVTVDDLMHLYRGGRLSKTSALAGSLLGIKPIIHVDNEGKLRSVAKVRGRKQALIRIVDDIEKLVGNVPNDTVFISHGDCLEDAEFVVDLVKERLGIKNHLINYVGAVIGSHTGPGVIALCLEGEARGI